MKKVTKFRDREDRKSGPQDRFVRTGGGIGGKAMEEQRRFNEDEGGGVEETLVDVSKDPNEGVSLGHQKGAD